VATIEEHSLSSHDERNVTPVIPTPNSKHSLASHGKRSAMPVIPRRAKRNTCHPTTSQV
jgi:hypothetical protein